MDQLDNIMHGSPQNSTRPNLKTISGKVIEYKSYAINPVAAPRMTRRDKWLKPPRPPVAKYYDYKTKIRLLKMDVCWNPLSLQFVIPMPDSWSAKKKLEMYLKPHTHKPDLDNLIKAFKDSLLEDDSGVWCYDMMTKVWGYTGSIIVINEATSMKKLI